MATALNLPNDETRNSLIQPFTSEDWLSREAKIETKNYNNFIRKLDERGRIGSFNGGWRKNITVQMRELAQPEELDFNETMTQQSAPGNQQIAVQIYAAATNIVITRGMLATHKGSGNQVDFKATKIAEVMTSIANYEGIRVNRAGNGPNQMPALQAWLPENGTGRVATLDGTTYPRFRAVVEQSITNSYDGIHAALRSVIQKIKFNGAGKPNLLYFAGDIYLEFESGWDAKIEWSNMPRGGGTPELFPMDATFKGLEIITDANSAIPENAGRIYVLNTDLINLDHDTDYYWKHDEMAAAAKQFANMDRFYDRACFYLESRQAHGVISI